MGHLDPRAPDDFMSLCAFVVGRGGVASSPEEAEVLADLESDPPVLIEMFGYVPTGNETFTHSPQDPHKTRVVVLDVKDARALHEALGGVLE